MQAVHLRCLETNSSMKRGETECKVHHTTSNLYFKHKSKRDGSILSLFFEIKRDGSILLYTNIQVQRFDCETSGAEILYC